MMRLPCEATLRRTPSSIHSDPWTQCWKKKEVNQTQRSKRLSPAKGNRRRQPGFQRGAVCAQRVRHEGGATGKGKIQKGLGSHTQRSECHPKGSRMPPKACTREHGRIRFAFWKGFPASFEEEGSERSWLLWGQGSSLESSGHHPGEKWDRACILLWNMGKLGLLKDT